MLRSSRLEVFILRNLARLPGTAVMESFFLISFRLLHATLMKRTTWRMLSWKFWQNIFRTDILQSTCVYYRSWDEWDSVWCFSPMIWKTNTMSFLSSFRESETATCEVRKVIYLEQHQAHKFVTRSCLPSTWQFHLELVD